MITFWLVRLTDFDGFFVAKRKSSMKVERNGTPISMWICRSTRKIFSLYMMIIATFRLEKTEWHCFFLLSLVLRHQRLQQLLLEAQQNEQILHCFCWFFLYSLDDVWIIFCFHCVFISVLSLYTPLQLIILFPERKCSIVENYWNAFVYLLKLLRIDR